jgi:hypothetical protein
MYHHNEVYPNHQHSNEGKVLLFVTTLPWRVDYNLNSLRRSLMGPGSQSLIVSLLYLNGIIIGYRCALIGLSGQRASVSIG